MKPAQNERADFSEFSASLAQTRKWKASNFPTHIRSIFIVMDWVCGMVCVGAGIHFSRSCEQIIVIAIDCETAHFLK